MIITFLPSRSDEVLTLERRGDALAVNGEVIDFSDLAEGETRELECDWLARPVTREGGVLQISVRFPHGPVPFPPPPEADVMLFPGPLSVTEDGPIALPLWEPPVPEVIDFDGLDEAPA